MLFSFLDIIIKILLLFILQVWASAIAITYLQFLLSPALAMFSVMKLLPVKTSQTAQKPAAVKYITGEGHSRHTATLEQLMQAK